MRILVTRPEPDAEPYAARLAAQGHEPRLAPLMRIVPERVSDIHIDDALHGAQALLVTSANGIRTLAAHRAGCGLPVLAVGEASAWQARSLGFDVAAAQGNVDSLVDLALACCDVGKGPLIHLAGSHVAGDLAGALRAAGFEVRRLVLYRAEAVTSLPFSVTQDLREGTIDAVALFSPRTARLMESRLRDHGLQDHAERLVALCLSSAVAGSLELTWRARPVAAQPTLDGLLALTEAAGR